MDNAGALFWMGNRLASNCVEISNDPSSLSKPGFWAVVNTFEGEWICARFATVVNAPLPAMPWQGITTTWQSSQSKSTYEDNVRLIKEKIADGDIYQVNLCRILSTDCNQSLQGLAVNLQSKKSSTIR
jgi:para-aminobenzoate synthetase component I